jgi:hypothetical protein
VSEVGHGKDDTMAARVIPYTNRDIGQVASKEELVIAEFDLWYKRGRLIRGLQAF